jgi:hypothetical protein
MADGLCKLVIIAGPMAGMEFPLVNRVTTVGRVAGNDIVIDDRSISRQHARLERVNGGFTVTDLGSQNGTVVGGERVTQATVPLGGRVVFGKIPCEIQSISSAQPSDQFQAPQPVPAGTDWGNLPAAPVRPLTAEDMLRASGAEAISPQEAARREEARRRRGHLVYIASLAAVVAIGLLAYFHIGAVYDPPRRGITVEVDQERLVGVKAAIEKRGVSADIVPEDKDVATAEQDNEIPWLIVVHGHSPGISDVVLRNEGGPVCIITVRVFAKQREARDRSDNLTDEERIKQAETLAEQARSAEKDHPWQSLKLYDAVEETVRPVQPSPAVRDFARDGTRRVRRRIDQQYKDLKDQYSSSAKLEDWEGAARSLEKIKDMVPDPNDLRYQRADILLEFVVRNLERRRGIFGRPRT